MDEKYIYLIIGVACLALGATMHFLVKNKTNSNAVLSWLLIALFPVFLIFSFFPDSTTSGNLLNFQVTGAMAAFAFIWYLGTSWTLKGADADKILENNTQLQTKLSEAEAKLDEIEDSDGAPVRRAKPLLITEKHHYKVGSQNAQVGLITGDIRNVKDVDIWVNSENTNMEMARFYENSISGIIRYMGARKDGVGNVKEDFVAEMLRREVGNNIVVQHATVIATGSGELERTNGVKKILHAAAVHGQVGIGYQPIGNIQQCVKNALAKADALNENLTSILLPLFATGMAEGDSESISSRLINEAVNYLQSNPNSKLKDVYFLAYTDKELEDCLKVLDNHPNLGKA